MNFRNFFGGHPIAVIVKLAVLSILLGVVLSAFGVTPHNILSVLDDWARQIYEMGFGAVEWLLRYLIVGAIIVVPIWLIVRLLKSADGPRNERD